MRRAFCLLISLISAGCDASHVDDVPMIWVLNEPREFHGVRVRLRGICRIEFEGNALYLSRASYADRFGKQAIWLNIGWPVTPEVLKLDGHEVSVEGTFDADAKGHLGAFAGSLTEVRLSQR